MLVSTSGELADVVVLDHGDNRRKTRRVFFFKSKFDRNPMLLCYIINENTHIKETYLVEQASRYTIKNN